MSTQEQRFGLASVLVGIGLAVVFAAGPALRIALPRPAIVVAFALATLLVVIGVGLLMSPAWRRGRRWLAGRGEPRLDVEPPVGQAKTCGCLLQTADPRQSFTHEQRWSPRATTRISSVRVHTCFCGLDRAPAPSLSIPAKATPC